MSALARAPSPVAQLALALALALGLGAGVLVVPARVAAQEGAARAEVTSEEAEEDARIAEQIRERQRLRPWHVLFGNLTWAASNVATLLGFLHFHDRWGWDGDPASTGCASGSAILGDFCSGPPWPHAIAVASLTVFYGATFTIAAFMPDPLDAGAGSGERAQRLVAHRVLRWALLGLLGAQLVLGAVVANVELSDFGAERALAATHLALGATTWATMTAMGVLGSLLAW